ncbi:MAG: hypothetical protein K5842_08635 [Bacteroidales bacterium]|nr:hypothetical protein [Bacteroidales bacterium]
MRKKSYRILWVDEEPDKMGFIEQCNKLDIEVFQYNSWDRAKAALESRFNTFSAIVLDAYCVLDAGQSADPDFLFQAVRELGIIFAQNEESLPWYVLSSGTLPDFERTIERIGMGEREEMESEWGRLFFRKGSDLGDLCRSIRHAVTLKKDNKVRALYREVFDVMDEYFTPDARKTMLDILMALHYPEENRNFDAVLYYTQLRRILEHLFRQFNKIGVLPDKVMGSPDKVNLANSSLYLAGREVYLGQGMPVRYGKPGQYVLPPVIAQLVKNILYVANKNSHTVELDDMGKTILYDYYNSLHSNNMLIGYTLHLCDVIVWFGQNFERFRNRQNKISQNN